MENIKETVKRDNLFFAMRSLSVQLTTRGMFPALVKAVYKMTQYTLTEILSWALTANDSVACIRLSGGLNLRYFPKDFIEFGSQPRLDLSRVGVFPSSIEVSTVKTRLVRAANGLKRFQDEQRKIQGSLHTVSISWV